MPSYISNSNERLPKNDWLFTWLLVLVIVLSITISWEIYCRSVGLTADGVADTADLWVKTRKKASILGKDATILIGASRIQLGINTDVLGKYTKTHPIQLAIDGSYFLPVLKNLAGDPSIIGTIIVDMEVDKLDKDLTNGRSEALIDYYTWSKSHAALGFYQNFEDYLRTKLDGLFAFRISGANPKTLVSRALMGEAQAASGYLTTLADRSRRADYALIPQNELYQARVQRNLGHDTLTTLKQSEWPTFHAHLSYLQGLVNKIQQRGGRVIFVRMPTDKSIWQIDETRLPRKLFWDVMAKNSTAEMIHFQDYSSLSKYNLPDGSHLDYRDAIPFTEALAQLLFKADN